MARTSAQTLRPIREGSLRVNFKADLGISEPLALEHERPPAPLLAPGVVRGFLVTPCFLLMIQERKTKQKKIKVGNGRLNGF